MLRYCMKCGALIDPSLTEEIQNTGSQLSFHLQCFKGTCSRTYCSQRKFQKWFRICDDLRSLDDILILRTAVGLIHYLFKDTHTHTTVQRSQIVEDSKSYRRSRLVFFEILGCDYNWSTQPIIQCTKGAGNLLVTAATKLSGISFREIKPLNSSVRSVELDILTENCT